MKFISVLLMLLLLIVAARAQYARHRSSHGTLPVISPAAQLPTQLPEQAIRLEAIAEVRKAELSRCEDDIAVTVGNTAADHASVQAELDAAQAKIKALEKDIADLKSAASVSKDPDKKTSP